MIDIVKIFRFLTTEILCNMIHTAATVMKNEVQATAFLDSTILFLTKLKL